MTAVFVSYTVSDRRLVESLAKLMRAILPDDIDLRYSGERAGGGGPAPGSQWFGWIVDQVKGCDVTLVVLTSSSVQKPWPMWEAGAVAGASFGLGQERPIVPVRYGVANERMPDPFRNLQSVDGSSRADLRALVSGSLMRKAAGSAFFEKFWAHPDTQAAIGTYLEEVAATLRELPIAPTEGTIDEWCRRLDDLRAQRRSAEAAQIERWISIAFGTRDAEREVPLDVRIHRRLSEMYMSVRDYANAIRQLQLAQELAPRDIFVLRALAEARLKSEDRDGAKAAMDAIQKLDAKAFEQNAECAGLRGRWNKMSSAWGAARDDYQRVLDLQPSYYMADNVGQLSARIGDVARARQVYEQARAIILKLQERSVWSHATLANAAIVIGDEPELQHLEAAAQMDPAPSAREIESIREGLEQLRIGLSVPAERVRAWEAALRRRGD
jgi:tetratricopeptide (TPR) repeat protein